VGQGQNLLQSAHRSRALEGGPNHAVIILEIGGNAYQKGGWIRFRVECFSGGTEFGGWRACPFAEAGFVGNGFVAESHSV